MSLVTGVTSVTMGYSSSTVMVQLVVLALAWYASKNVQANASLSPALPIWVTSSDRRNSVTTAGYFAVR